MLKDDVAQRHGTASINVMVVGSVLTEGINNFHFRESNIDRRYVLFSISLLGAVLRVPTDFKILCVVWRNSICVTSVKT